MRILVIQTVFSLLITITSEIRNVNSLLFEGKIAGNRTLQDCTTGGLRSDSFMTTTTTTLIEQAGYPAEEHTVLTDDGYILTIHRIPGKLNATPVFLHHALFSSSFDWVAAGRGKALGFILSDRGYDVWMGNVRGNIYSQCHTNYTASDPIFWDFSWHEMGIYDLPATITYITNETKKNLLYVGYSMGTTTFYVMAAERPDILPRVTAMFSLAPIAYLSHAKSIVFLLTPFTYVIETYLRILGVFEIPPLNEVTKDLAKYFCTIFLWQRKLCVEPTFLVNGFDPEQYNYAILPLVLYHFPAGGSIKTLVHYAQLRMSGKFQNYDYGSTKNLEYYESNTPPEYNISRAQIPIALFWSENDYFANPKDVQKLHAQLPNVILYYKIRWQKFNHMDYAYGIDAFKYVYHELLSVMKNFE